MFKLFRFLKPYWLQVIALLIATGLQVYATLRLPALMAEIINNGIMASDTGFIWLVGGRMLLLTLFSALMDFFSSYFSATIGANFSRDLREEVFTQVVNFSLIDSKDFSTASLITRTTIDVSQVQQAITMMLSMMLRAPLFCIVGLVMAYQTAPDMSWIIVVGVAGVLITIATIITIVMPKFRIFQSLVDKITLLTRENLTGLRVIRAFNNEKIEKKKFTKANNELTRVQVFIEKILKLANPIVNVMFNGTTLLCYYVGIHLLSQDVAYLGNMSAFAQYVTHVMFSFLMLSMLFIMLPRANVSAERINQVLKTLPKIKWEKKTKVKPSKTASVEFKNVGFSYPGAEEKVLSKVSFVAKAGETTAFIGSTGSGKSTLINLVPRFYEATEGEILVNGVSIRDYAKDDLIEKIGFVPQKGVLFSGTVASNIKFGAPNASSEEVEHSAKVAQADGFIRKMPGGYSAHIAQGGTNVSGGQKQRLSIARAVCKKPDVYIFDDAFSALDMKTDQKLREALKPETHESVVLIVAQRISTIRDAEQIVVLDKGVVVGKGTHYDLIRDSLVYRGIVESQLSEKEFKEELKKAGVKNIVELGEKTGHRSEDSGKEKK